MVLHKELCCVKMIIDNDMKSINLRSLI